MKTSQYSHTAIAIHWIMAIMIIVMIVMGSYMSDLPRGSDRSWFFALHKSLGLTLALLALFRLVWKLMFPPPALPADISQGQQKLAKINHNLLYVLMFLQPMTGYISSSFSGYKTKFWGIPLPHWGWKWPALNDFFSELHDLFAIGLIVCIILHVAGVVYHLHQGHTNVLKRMWFFNK